MELTAANYHEYKTVKSHLTIQCGLEAVRKSVLTTQRAPSMQDYILCTSLALIPPPNIHLVSHHVSVPCVIVHATQRLVDPQRL
jgi:hypothetical protein